MIVVPICIRFQCCFYLQKGFQKILFTDHLPIQQKSFPHSNQMRRDKGSYMVAGMAKDRSQKCTDGSLSIGSGHVNDLQLPIRISQKSQKSFRVFHRVLGRKFRYTQNVFFCLLVGHCVTSMLSQGGRGKWFFGEPLSPSPLAPPWLLGTYPNCASLSRTCSIICVYFSSFARSSATFASGAFDMNRSLLNMPFTRASSPSNRFSSF